MSCTESLQSSSLDVYPLSSSESRQVLCTFSQLLLSCAGPHGKNHIVRNNCGGHVTITSICSRLLAAISLSRSELKLVASVFTGHLQQSGDCGLFMAHTCLHLTRSSLDLGTPHNLLSSTFQSFFSIVANYIQSQHCDVRVKADFSDVNVLLAYVRSILTSKTLLNIPSQELNDLSLTILNAFVKAIPSAPLKSFSNGVFVLGVEKSPIKNCKLEEGILLEFPEYSIHSDPAEWMIGVGERDDKSSQAKAPVKVALITCSMSGEMEDVVAGTLEATEHQFVDLEQDVIEKMKSFCDDLGDAEVEIILCQRVIHPCVKAHLRLKGIVFVDRIGSQLIPFLRDLTGCQPIATVLQTSPDIGKRLGRLTSVTPSVENGKGYIHLQNSSATVLTLVVCGEWEERLSELKHCVRVCLLGLQSLVKEPSLLMGGGCWQMHCSYYLKEKVLGTLPEMCEKLSCSESTMRRLLAIFTSCLHLWCLNLKTNEEHLVFDPSSRHCWRVPKGTLVSLSHDERQTCCCGFRTMSVDCLHDLDIIIARDDSFLSTGGIGLRNTDVKTAQGYEFAVLDSLKGCMEAFQKGVWTAGLLLSIGQIICDRK